MPEQTQNTSTDSKNFLLDKVFFFNYYSIVKIIALFVILSCVSIFFGWFFGIPFFKTLFDGFLAMEFVTLVSFFFSGCILFLIAFQENKYNEQVEVFLPLFTIVLFMVISIVFAASMINVSTGLEYLFSNSKPSFEETVFIVPPLGVLFGFVLVGLVGIIVLRGEEETHKLLTYLGLLVFFLGGIALAGYFVGQSVLYYDLKGLSVATAMHSAVLFVILGVGFWLVGENHAKKNPQIGLLFSK